MKKSVVVLLCIFSVFYANATSSINAKFFMHKKAFIEQLWKLNPDWATTIGYHKYDSVLLIPNALQREKEITFLDNELKYLKKIPVDSLADLEKIDYHLIKNFVEESKWKINTLKQYEWNPAEYNVGETFAYILSENYASLKTRIDNFYAKLRNVPAYFETAKTNIKNPTNEHLQLAIEQNEGSLSIFENDYVDSVKALRYYPEHEEQLLKRGKEAVVAIKSYIQFLKDFKNENPRSFRLGSELYADKFKYQIQSQYTPDEIYAAALQRKDYLHNEMYIIASKLWTKYFGSQTMPNDKLVLIKKVIDTISVQHVKAENFKQEIEKQLPELTAFVKAKNLIYMDPTKPLKVRKEPGYMAGIAGASMSSPGPYEKKGTAFYNVGTLEGWSPEKAESYLREYNKYVLQILNIHEAIPGHYVQLMYSNQSPSIIKSVFQNSTMIEGWAVYSELMMLENGYGNNEPEMWLLYYKWNLRSTCNTILDISVHTKNMSETDAMDLLVRQAFQQKTEAEGKWHRVQVTNVQLDCYFTGFKEITDLRNDYKTKLGNTYTVKKFNEKFLSYGSSPVKYIREMMLK
ncbi:MAG TPA: DUF885 domain-containing protein [Chitinophagales bacterium]|nr:DUF885 domain-containing protein [Chitinophagales bacterium]